MAVVIEGLTKEYERGGRVFKAVDSVSLQLKQGDFISITGKSGSGKSTLLNMIAGLTSPTSGSIHFDGEELFSKSDAEISKYRGQKIGYVPQGQSLLSRLTVLENVLLPFHIAHTADSAGGGKGVRDTHASGGGNSDDGGAERAEETLNNVGIAHLAGSYPKHLSGGEMKRAAIARALINSPLLLLADEPTSDLDAQTTDDVLSLIQAVSQGGTTVLMVTHDLDAVRYGSGHYQMRSGVLSKP